MNQKKKLLQYRRERVLNLYSEGRSQYDIAKEMQISQPTIHRDLQFERKRINCGLDTYFEEQLPLEHQACIVGINRIIRMAWEIAWKSFGRKPDSRFSLVLGRTGYPPSVYEDIDSGHKIILQALSLAKDCYRMKADLMAHTTTANKAAKLIESYKIRLREAETRSEVIHTHTRTLEMKGEEEQQR
jgi:hypothetical protein